MRPPPRAAALVLLALTLAACGRTGGEPYQPALNTPVPLGADDPVGQTVNPVDDVVSAVDLPIATYDAAPDPEGELAVRLVDPVDGALLGTAAVGGAALAAGTWVAVPFDPPAPVGDLVLVEVTWDGASPAALWADRTLEGTAGIDNDPYPAGQLRIGGEPVDGDLAFRVRSPSGPQEVLAQVVEVARSTGARLADQPAFTGIWVLALAGAGALAVTGLRRRRP